MKRFPSFLRHLLLPISIAGLIQASPVFAAEQTSDLVASFVHPPSEAGPWVYWYWCNGNITKEGITADLEAMARTGIGGVLILDAAVQTPAGKASYNSPQWHEMIRFALNEAARLGIRVSMTNGPGWCGSGAPWITPEQSEQQLVWTETTVRGPVHYDAVLARPRTTTHSSDCIKAVGDYYKDIALFAFPTLADDGVSMADFSPKVTASATDPKVDLQAIVSGTGSGKLLLPKPGPDKPQYVQVEFDRPYKARVLNLTLSGSPEWSGMEAELQVSDDGSQFKSVRKFIARLEEEMVGFEAVTGRYFRVLFAKGDANLPPKFGVCALQLSPRYRFDSMRGKTLVTRADVGAPAAYPNLPAGLAIDGTSVINLTSKLDKEGRLSWEAPAGQWTLLRIGHTSRGAFNHPAPNGGIGLECDKMSKEASDAHFAALMGKLIEEAGPLAGKTLVGVHIDSWEPGTDNLQRTQNWTARFREEFQARRGYDLLRFFPAMTGRVVDTLETTERFLWDFRQTAGELLAENYAGRIGELGRQHGLKLSIEAYGGGPFDDLTYGARADIPMAEFWSYPDHGAAGTAVEMSSVAHVYGKQIAAAESFTALPDEKWLAYPGSLKTEADWALSVGINRLTIHTYPMQPWLTVKPAMGLGAFGLHYGRTQTWWEQSGPWHQYLARCQYLLQQGLCAADICYLELEGSPRSPNLPSTNSKWPIRPSYGYDVAPAEAVLTRFSVKDGKMVLPDGMSYRVLVLPEAETMTPALLRKIKELVADGATVIGRRPLKSPSFSNYPACDAEIKALADELWSDCDGKTVKEHRFGKGRIIWGRTPQEVLAEMNVPPDFACKDPGAASDLVYIHRAIGGSDAYFVANQKNQPVAVTARFRVTGRQPEFWHPETGRTEPVAIYTQEDGVTSVPLQLDAAESLFVVFQPASKKLDPAASLALNGHQIIPSEPDASAIVIQKATFGPAGDPTRVRDVRARLQELLDQTHLTTFPVAQVTKGAGDPAPGIVKTLTVDYTVDGQPQTASAADLQSVTLAGNKPAERVAQITSDAKGRLRLEAWKPGDYEVKTASGKTQKLSVAAIPAAMEITSPWQVAFPFQKEAINFDKLVSWSDHPQQDVKYFSGTATYRTTFKLPAGMIAKDRRLYLDLGDVQVNAEVTLNGKKLDLLWKAPYRLEITDAAQHGDNSLEIAVTNLWPNRLIGDAQLPADKMRSADGTLRGWPEWLLEGKPDPSGRQSFACYELWKKDDALIPSGLLGPVTVLASADIAVPEFTKPAKQ